LAHSWSSYFSLSKHFLFLSDIRVERLWRIRSTRYRRNLYRDGSDPTEKNQNHNDKKRQT
jgi:hypothetical protein